MFQVTLFSFHKSRSLTIRSHVPSTVGQLDYVAALGSGFISCTALDRTLGVRPPDTLTAGSPGWLLHGHL